MLIVIALNGLRIELGFSTDEKEGAAWQYIILGWLMLFLALIVWRKCHSIIQALLSSDVLAFKQNEPPMRVGRDRENSDSSTDSSGLPITRTAFSTFPFYLHLVTLALFIILHPSTHPTHTRSESDTIDTAAHDAQWRAVGDRHPQ